MLRASSRASCRAERLVATKDFDLSERPEAAIPDSCSPKRPRAALSCCRCSSDAEATVRAAFSRELRVDRGDIRLILRGCVRSFTLLDRPEDGDRGSGDCSDRTDCAY